ncbi:hypothetical protein K2173_009902 [Erythroxylum novogranatense]|uniref:Protein FAR1-RELATED SEQUENCE n=1 Tax=Erythroxylum novogranatense TaxID=1862640 RepID=A0AAV8SZ85_9ROSI|nr:hypothetical protein K2173_009902 [Erythroxylum novogranatense]
MEINLELPSHEREKVDTISTSTAVVTDSADGLDASENDINSLASEHDIKFGEPNENEVITCERETDESAVGAEICKRDMIFEPQNGLKFETKEAAYSFYREYARSVGFGITIKASRRSKKSGKFIDVKIACSRFGSKRDSNAVVIQKSCVKTDCKAGMHMKRTQDEKWIIHSFIKEHNHEICPDDFCNAIRGGNKQSDVVAGKKKGLQSALDEDDIQIMLKHFMCMQAENPNFFYAIDLDSEKRMKSVFWIDTKGRNDYKIFSDVVLFDTFYLESKYKIPLVPIVGVNHHFQFILFGCALIGEQNKSTFTWLMRTWSKAVGGQAPRVIITGREKYLTEAAVDVFSDARHCHCLWHVLSKVTHNLHLMNLNEKFMAKFNKCIHRSWTDEQFEKRWSKMVDKFELRLHEWICSLYEDRKKWVPTYMQDVFLAGMSTAERVGSIPSFFDKYIHRESTFKEFMEEYNIFLQDRFEMEAKADFETQNKQPTVRSLSSFEKQMSTIYTDAVFRKFQVELLGVVSCHLQKENEDEEALTFRVDDFEERQYFLVSWNEEALNVSCTCRSFEYRGILCKHAILVLQMSGLSIIPSPYILKRWTKDAKISQAVSQISSSLHYRVQRFNDLCKRAIKLGKEGSLSQEAYDIAFDAIEEALQNCKDSNNSIRSFSKPNALAVHGFVGTEENNSNIVSRPLKKRKFYKKKKVQSESERTTIGLQETCKRMMNSRAHPVDNCHFPQSEIPEMESGSRAPTLDGYYGPQQSIQGTGHLNSIPPIRDDYYSSQQGFPGLVQLISTRTGQSGNQQGMQGLGQLGFRLQPLPGCFSIQNVSPDMEQSVTSTQFHGIAKHPLD